jgi:hypothetical protein
LRLSIGRALDFATEFTAAKCATLYSEDFYRLENFFASNRSLRHPDASVEKHEILKNALDGRASLRGLVVGGVVARVQRMR